MSDTLFERLHDLSVGTGSRTPLVAIERIEELKKELREMSLQVLASEGQAQENFQLYVDANEARLDLEGTLRDIVTDLKAMLEVPNSEAAQGILKVCVRSILRTLEGNYETDWSRTVD